ncbi:MAG: hypothetical protein EHM72_00125 [Calditrichaeota bacterium]|nr:MAG: hypothetical protein EHM72_00125 [Calditrichota bacterium]
MEQGQKTTVALKPGIQLQLLRYMLTGSSPSAIIDAMQAFELIPSYQFVWEKTLELGIRIKGDHFSQSDIFKRLKTSEQYKMEIGCAEPLQRCEANDCLFQNPDCLKNKLKEQIISLYRMISEYLGIEFKP